MGKQFYEEGFKDVQTGQFATFFTLKDGETCNIRFLSKKPLTMRRHNLWNLNAKGWETCSGEDDCYVCSLGDNASIRVMMPLIDRRKEKSKDAKDKKVVKSDTLKVLHQGPKFMTLLETVYKAKIRKRCQCGGKITKTEGKLECSKCDDPIRCDLTTQDFEITRAGAQTDTQYIITPDWDTLGELTKEDLEKLKEFDVNAFAPKSKAELKKKLAEFINDEEQEEEEESSEDEEVEEVDEDDDDEVF